jgi:hypothetical protein
MMVILAFLWALLSLGMIAEPARAQWTPVDERYQAPWLRTIYIEKASVRREGEFATVRVLIDWNAMQGGRSPGRFFSTIVKKQFDCSKQQVRLLAFADFFGHMGTGERIASAESDGPWRAVESGSLNAGLRDLACDTR